jgi:solute carrier family 25 protein 16
MFSSHLRDLTKVVTAAVSANTVPLPEDLLETVQAYHDRHATPDEHDSQRLQDDLLGIYSKYVEPDPTKYAVFLAVLRQVQPAIRGSDRLLEWWNLLVKPILDTANPEKAVLDNVDAILMNVLVYEEDDDASGEAARASAAYTTKLLDAYMEKSQLAGDGESLLNDDFRGRIVATHLESVLVAFGKKRSKALLAAVDRYIVTPKRRLQALSLLCAFLRFQPHHLHQVLETSLFEHLLKCLTNDTSTTAVALALTNVVMLIPHIPNLLVRFLPRLFIIYARLLCWNGAVEEEDGFREEKIGSPSSVMTVIRDPTWDSIDATYDAGIVAEADVGHFFTHLYGIYPLNFMAFIREPVKYLQSSVFTTTESDLDESLIREKSERLRQQHLLHPNFFEMTAEEELSDRNRWQKSEPADILALCMSLRVVTYSVMDGPGPPPTEALPEIPSSMIPTEDIPDHSLLSTDEDDVLSGEESDRRSWRNTQSTAVSSAAFMDHTLTHKASNRSLARTRSVASFARLQSPGFPPRDLAVDSPTLPPLYTVNPPEHKVQDMLLTQETLRNGLNQSHANESVHSFQTHESHSSPRLDAYIHSLAASTAAKSPAFRPAPSDPHTTVAMLQSQVLMLKNDLNFERYLKQQQSVHIGQLQKKHIREQRGEALTQGMLNTNRSLKASLEKSKAAYASLKSESLKAKLHAKRWQDDLNAKLAKLREEQRARSIDEKTLFEQLNEVKHECEQLKQMCLDAEKRELSSRQKLHSAKQDLADNESLRAQVEALVAKLRDFERQQDEGIYDDARFEQQHTQIEKLRLQLRARDGEKEHLRSAYEAKVTELETKLASSAPPSAQPPAAFQAMLQSALASSKVRMTAMQKRHNELLDRYRVLERDFLELRAERELRYSDDAFDDRSLMTDEIVPLEDDDASLDYRGGRKEYFGPTASSFNNYRSTQNYASPPHNSFRSPLTSPREHGSYLYGLSSPPGSLQHTHSTSYRPSDGTIISAGDSESSESTRGQGQQRPVTQPIAGKPKVTPTSEVRVRGRGGVQNIGKKEREKKDRLALQQLQAQAEREAAASKDGSSGTGSATKSGKSGLRSILG